MKAWIPVENGDTLCAVRGVLRKLLSSDLMDGLMVPMRIPSGAVMPALVTDPTLLDQADPLAPVFPVNSARLLGWMTQREPRGRIGAVMRSCEMRAMVELVKLKQGCLDCVTLVSIDCAGTYDVPVYIQQAEELGENGIGQMWRELFDDPVAGGSNAHPLRDACTMCEMPVYEDAPIAFEFLGNDLSRGFHVSLPDEMADELALGGEVAGPESPTTSPAGAAGSKERAQVLQELTAQRTARRDVIFAEIRDQLRDDGIDKVFAACIRCHNCMTVCPICYCKTCLFRGPVFDHEPIQYMRWAEGKGALRLPSDTMLFHLTRLNHMALSCVGCGMCTSVCPAELPVGRVFRAVGDSLQEVFGYAPGFHPEEPLPLVAFQEDEWQEVGA